MSTAELHPEELLDRERSGRLTDSEREKLDAHASRCAACRLERSARAQLDRDLESAEGDGALIDRAVHRAVDRALDRAAGPAPETAPDSIRLARRGRRAVWLLAAAAALAAVAAAAAFATRPGRVSAPRNLDTPVVPAPTTALTGHPESQPGSQPESELQPSPEPDLAVSPLPEPLPSGKIRLGEQGSTAAELFAGANRARRDKRDADAIRLYRELQSRFPDSREARASRVMLGQLLLDQRDPSQALGEFDGYLKEGAKGAVTEEAIVGRARALQKLGRTAEERAAWQELLAKFPSSVHAAQARERLGATKP